MGFQIWVSVLSRLVQTLPSSSLAWYLDDLLMHSDKEDELEAAEHLLDLAHKFLHTVEQSGLKLSLKKQHAKEVCIGPDTYSHTSISSSHQNVRLCYQLLQ